MLGHSTPCSLWRHEAPGTVVRMSQRCEARNIGPIASSKRTRCKAICTACIDLGIPEMPSLAEHVAARHSIIDHILCPHRIAAKTKTIIYHLPLANPPSPRHDDSEAYCWRWSGFFWRMRASLGLACAQATTLSSQVFGKGNLRSRAGRPSA